MKKRIIPLAPGNTVLGLGDQPDSGLGVGEIMELDTVLLNLNASIGIDILYGRHVHQGLEDHLRDRVWSLGKE